MAELDTRTDTAAPEPPAGSNGQERPAAAHRHPWLRRIGWTFAGLLGLPIALVLVVILLLQTGWGARTVRDFALEFVNENVIEGATLTAAELDGSFVRGLLLHDVQLTKDDGSVLAQVDTLRARYRLLPLLQRRLEIRELVIRDPYVQMTQLPDSTWDLLNVLPASAEDTTTQRQFGLSFDLIRLQDGAARVRFHTTSGGDSVLVANDLNVRAHDVGFSGGVHGQVDSLWAEVVPPGTDLPVDLAFHGGLSEAGEFTLHTLLIESPRSTVRGAGSLRLPQSDDATFEDIDFELTAAPLDFADIAAFVPAVNPEATLTLDVSVAGSARRLVADVEGRLGDGGTLDLSATASPPALAEALTYKLDARIRGLNPGYLLASASPQNDALEGQINLEATADLEGPALDALSGPFRLALTDTRLAGYALDATVLDGRFADGTARLDLTTGLRGARFSLGGTLQPFADVPAADLQGRFAGVDIGRLTDTPDQQSNLSGSLRVQARGFQPETADLQATLDLAPSRFNQFQIDDGRLTVDIDGQTIDFDTRLRFPEGRLAVDGSANRTDPLAYRVATGRFESLDVAALTGDTTRSSLTGSFTLDGRGTDPATMGLDASLELEPSVYGTYAIEAATAAAHLRNGRFTLDAGATLEGGTVSIAAAARPFAEPMTYEVTRGRFEDVNLATLLQNPQLESDLTGTFDLRGRGTDPAALQLDASFSLSESALNAQSIDGADGAVTLDGGQLVFDLGLDLPQGRTAFTGSARPFAEPMTYTLTEGTFTGLDVGALAGRSDIATSLTGTLTLDGTGTDPQTMTLDAALELAASSINDERVETGRLTATFADGLGDVDARFDLADGRATLDASGRFLDDVPTYQAAGAFVDLDLGGLLGVDTLSAGGSLRFDVEGSGTDPMTMELSGRLTASGLSFQDVAIDTALAEVRLADGMARVDTLYLNANVATLHGSGPLALSDSLGTRTSDFTFGATLRDLGPLEPFLQADLLALGTGEIQGEVAGRPGTLQVRLDTELNSLVYNDIRLAGFEARVLAEMGRERTLQLAEVRGTLEYISVPALTVENTRFEATYRDDELRFTTEMLVDERRDARLSGRIELAPEQQRIVVEDLGLRFDEDRWELLQEASIAYGDAYRVSNLLLYAGDQQIALDGVIDFDGRQSLILTIEEFRTNAVADLLGFEGLGGTLNGYVDLTGPADAPNLGGALNLDLASYNRAVGTLDLELAYDALRLAVDARLTHQEGSELVLDGSLPMDLRLSSPSDTSAAPGLAIDELEQRDQEVDLALRADSFAIGWVRPFLDPTMVDRLEGHLTADVQIGGTLEGPDLSGSATLQDGLVRLPEFGVTYSAIDVGTRFEEDRIVLEQARMFSGRGARTGRLTAEGTIALSDLTLGTFDLTVQADEFLALDSKELSNIRIDGDCSLEGTTERPELTCGTVTVLSADIYLTDETSSDAYPEVQLTEADLRQLEQVFGVRVTEADTTTFDFYEALTMDLSVQIERDTWIRSEENPEMAIQFTGNLDVQKQAMADPQVFGSIEVIPQRSSIQQFGKEFDITSGTLTFNGPATDPQMAIEAEYRVPNRDNPGTDPVVITLAVSGRLDNLNIEPGSRNPANMELTDIISYVVFGRPASQSFLLGGGGGSGQTGVGEIGAGLALGQIAGLLESTLGDQLGLDVIEIEQNGLEGTTITAGTYYVVRGLPNPIFLAVSQPISYGAGAEARAISTGQGTQITIEYELLRGLLASLNGGSTGRVRFNLLWRTSY